MFNLLYFVIFLVFFLDKIVYLIEVKLAHSNYKPKLSI